MSGQRQDEAIVRELEQELRAALNVEPSADFVRRVRARIDERPSGFAPTLADVVRSLSMRRLAPATVAVCIVAVGLGWLFRHDRTDFRPKRNAGDVRLMSEVQSAPAPAAVAHQRTPERTSPRAAPPQSTRTTRTVVASAAGEPEIIVPQDRARALARLLALARSGVVDEQSLLPVASAAASATLDVPPIVVPSIPVPDVEIRSGAAREGTGGE
jgi:hypothetical protein